MIRLFEKGQDDRRAVLGDNGMFQTNPDWKDFIPFHEYFHGDNGSGVGASHQTGWTGLCRKNDPTTIGMERPPLGGNGERHEGKNYLKIFQ